MTYEEFASDLPPDYTKVFTSPEDLEKALQGYGVFQPTRQSRKGTFRAALAVRNTEFTELFADRYSTALSLHLVPPQGASSILIPRSVSGQFLASGFNLAHDHMLFFPHGTGTDIVGPGPIGSEGIAIPDKRFFEMMEALCPTADGLKELTIVKVDAPQLRAIGDEVVKLIGEADVELQGERLTNLLALTVTLIGEASDQWQPEDLNDNGAHSRVARKAQEIIEEDYMKPLHLEDLCRETGVGARTLQRCFRAYFDLTITDYLKTVRLESVRRELLATDPVRNTVTEIAMRNGCSHPGRLAVEYRERYGVSPSETLAMRPGRK